MAIEQHNLCPNLDEKLLECIPQSLGSDADFNGLPSKGIYFFYEQGETCTGHGTEGLRIVYVGSVRADQRMGIRIKSHYYRNSSLRSHIGNVFLIRKFGELIDFKLGSQGSADFPRSIKTQLNSHFRVNMMFRFIPVNDDSYRKELEERLVATIASCPVCRPSPKWLGLESPEYSIRNGKLWNIEYIGSSRQLRQGDLEHLC